VGKNLALAEQDRLVACAGEHPARDHVKQGADEHGVDGGDTREVEDVVGGEVANDTAEQPGT